MNDDEKNLRLRELPAVSSLVENERIAPLCKRHGHDFVVAVLRSILENLRQKIIAGKHGNVDFDAIVSEVNGRAQSSLRTVINASGVVVHTNLGRAPLALSAQAALAALAKDYSTLEYDLHKGARGSRHQHAVALLAELTGAEDAAVVNNNAAAVLLSLSALAHRREVIVSRGEQVEIGGGFRIPDVMRQSGAHVVEVGTTNRTRIADYAEAVSADTALLLKVHRSNFALVGFTEETGIDELAELGNKHDIAVMYDAGSGCLRALEPLTAEPTIGVALEQGAKLVTFSGDKLLGGPQAGIIVGSHALIEKIRRHPLMRAVRPDKLCLAALIATLESWRRDWREIPVARAITMPAGLLQQRATELLQALADIADLVELSVCTSVDRVGGGASPLTALEGWALCLRNVDAEDLSTRLRSAQMPLIVRVEDDAVWVHMRCIDPEHIGLVASQLRWAVRLQKQE